MISPIKIFCIEVGEAYKNKLKYRLLWNKLLHHAEQYEADPRYDKFISLSMDDPSITPTEKCRFYLGITLRDDTKARPGTGNHANSRRAICRVQTYGELFFFTQSVQEHL